MAKAKSRARMAKAGAGELTERLTLLTTTPVAVPVTSLTRAGSLATATTSSTHGFTTGDYVTHAGADQAEYNVEAQVTVTSPTTYTFTVDGTPATPATGTITATFTSDSSGGQGTGWYTLATVWGQMLPLSASELLQAQAIGSQQAYRAKIYYRADVTPKMRVQWTPYQFTTPKTLEIHGVLPDADEPRRFMVLDVAEVI
jgi:SPP1 family predicted phage head-tail adaptor